MEGIGRQEAGAIDGLWNVVLWDLHMCRKGRETREKMTTCPGTVEDTSMQQWEFAEHATIDGRPRPALTCIERNEGKEGEQVQQRSCEEAALQPHQQRRRGLRQGHLK